MSPDIKNISIVLAISIIVVYVCHLINSTVIFKYINDNLITILLAFLAINTATLGHLAAKIQDVMIVHKHLDFATTTQEMKKSLLEQIIMIGLSTLILIVRESEINFSLKTEILNVFSFSVFLYAVNVLWDTGKSVFVIIDEIRKLNK